APDGPPGWCSSLATPPPEATNQPGSSGECVAKHTSRYSSSGAIMIIAMSRSRRCRRGSGGAASLTVARGRLPRSGIARATVIHCLRKPTQCLDLNSKVERLQGRMHEPPGLDIDPPHESRLAAPVAGGQAVDPGQDRRADRLRTGPRHRAGHVGDAEVGDPLL